MEGILSFVFFFCSDYDEISIVVLGIGVFGFCLGSFDYGSFGFGVVFVMLGGFLVIVCLFVGVCWLLCFGYCGLLCGYFL